MSKSSKVIPGHSLQLTSVKMHPHVMRQFQEKALNLITLQKLVNRSLHLFANDPEFRKTILSYTVLLPSGSL